MLANPVLLPELYIFERRSPSGRVKVWPGNPPIPHGFIQENHEYIFELANTTDLERTDLLIDDARPDALYSRKPGVAQWIWKPGFYAGWVECQLDLPGNRKYRFEVVTDPDARKLTRDHYHKMIGEILEDSIALFSISSFRIGIGRGTGDTPPPIARLEYLRSRIENLEKIIRYINSHSVRVLRGHVEWTRPGKVKTFPGEQLARSFVGGNLIRVENPSLQKRLPSAMSGYFPARIRKPIKTTGLNIREHQQIKAALISWAGILEYYASILGCTGGVDAEQQTQSSRWANRCCALSIRLRGLLALPLFDEVTTRSSLPSLSSIYQRIPAYRQFFQLYQEMGRGISNIFGDFLNIPMAHTYDLYELWCFLRILRAFEKQYGNIVITTVFPTMKQGSGNLVIPRTEVKFPIPGFGLFSFKRNYVEFWHARDKIGSFTHPMEPDLTIETTDTQGNVRVIVLDAKYRIEQQLTDAISSIHMYRDAIITPKDGNDVDFHRVVIGAYLLTPFMPGDMDTDWRKMDMPSRLFHREYRGQFNFGAATLRPGMSIEDVGEVMNQIIFEVTGKV